LPGAVLDAAQASSGPFDAAQHNRIATAHGQPVQLGMRASLVIERATRPPRHSRANSCRRELPDRTLIWNQAHLRRVLSQYETHHNQHRPHRALRAAAAETPAPAS